ncbi:Riboflavin biosynthesis protein ribd [Thalictrum thalictroides]|uniref:Riboflavin biosynthesis protein ribd n=1 Tax=Thalictrum thalictroides TaxID=46969 RepID=A0A7J6V3F5_THATH|nr:Riboflavin biosynthesis protein ribd [Thalictrum thalictroides]
MQFNLHIAQIAQISRSANDEGYVVRRVTIRKCRVFALRDAGDLAANATTYVNLEPCNHYRRTPPCTEALISAKVKRVVVSMVNPNPIVASKGVEKLRDSGIDVTVDVEEELCKKLKEAYIHRMLTGKPFVL